MLRRGAAAVCGLGLRWRGWRAGRGWRGAGGGGRCEGRGWGRWRAGDGSEERGQSPGEAGGSGIIVVKPWPEGMERRCGLVLW